MDAPVAPRRSGPVIPKMGVDGQAAVKSPARACSCHRSGRAAWTQWLRVAKPSCQPRPDPMASAVLSLVHMGGRKGGAQARGRRMRPALGTRAGEVAQEQQVVEPGRAPSLHAGYGMAEYLDVDIRSVQGPSRVEWTQVRAGRRRGK